MVDVEVRQELKRQKTAMDKIADAMGKAAKRQEEELLEKNKSTLIEIQAKVYDKAAAYTNLIMIGGYAGAFSTWSATRAQLPARANIVIAFALSISLASFVLFEVYKMTKSALMFMRNRSLLTNATTPQKLADNIKLMAAAEQKLSLAIIPVWVVALILSVGGGLIALGLLFYNYLALLVQWPLWPK